MLSHTLTSCGDSTDVVNLRDFDFLLSTLTGFISIWGMRSLCPSSTSIISTRQCIFCQSIFHQARLPYGHSLGDRQDASGRGYGTHALKTLHLMRLVHRVETVRGTEYRVTLTDDPPATDTASPQPPPAKSSWAHSCWSPAASKLIFCSSTEFQWLQRYVVHIAEHLGVRVLPKPPSPVRPSIYQCGHSWFGGFGHFCHPL